MRIDLPKSVVIALTGLLAGGCVGFGGLANSLAETVAAQQDPALVRDGAPAYLLMVDSLIREEPNDAELLMAGARLNGAYAGAFVDEPERARIMAGKARDYARRALCLRLEAVCEAADGSLADYEKALAGVAAADVEVLYAWGSAWAGFVQARSDDWNALAALPKVQATLARVVELEPGIDHGNALAYLGVLHSLRPPALGGEPATGRAHFERAIDVSDGHNLMAKVLYAEHYARLVFDRALHDRLLQEVVEAEVGAPALRLANALAKARARRLLDSADQYF